MAIAALAGTVFFSVLASRGIFQFEDAKKPRSPLPGGCPPACQGAALDRFELAGVDFSNANLAQAKLRDANLDGRTFEVPT